MRRASLWAVFGLCCATGFVAAENYYVSNLDGRDQNDGLAEKPLNALTGPVKTIRRGIELAGTGDTIVIANTGEPYYESITLVGNRVSGIGRLPFTIRGNGATISGLRQLPKEGWRRIGPELWQVSFNRKGFYYLLRDGFRAPEYQPDNLTDILETLPAGHWCAYRGTVVWRQQGINEPTEDRFDYAADEMGITLYHVDNVKIVDLVVEHFRVDGINAHNMCSEIVLENVTCRENGRAGLAVGGTSKVVFREGKLEANGREAALVTGKGLLTVENSDLDAEPTVKP